MLRSIVLSTPTELPVEYSKLISYLPTLMAKMSLQNIQQCTAHDNGASGEYYK